MSMEILELNSSRSQIHFAVRHLVFSKTRGRFNRWSGTVIVPDGDFSRATVNVVIDASSIDTGVDRRDEHLRAADYLDVKRFPNIVFSSQRVLVGPEGSLRVAGALTLKGVTHEVVLDVAIGRADIDRAQFSATATVDRRDFELTGNPALASGGLVIGQRIEVEIEISAQRRPAVRAA